MCTNYLKNLNMAFRTECGSSNSNLVSNLLSRIMLGAERSRLAVKTEDLGLFLKI